MLGLLRELSELDVQVSLEFSQTDLALLVSDGVESLHGIFTPSACFSVGTDEPISAKDEVGEQVEQGGEHMEHSTYSEVVAWLPDRAEGLA